MKRLIVIRGNSGSGKSSLSKELRERAKNPKKVALIEQDYLRRTILKEKETEGTVNIDLIKQTVLFALDRDYDVILEGIFFSERYKEMILELIEASNSSFVFYMDVSLGETLERHKSKHNTHEFGEKEMRDWYNKDDRLDVMGEIVISEDSTMEESVITILKVSGI